MAVVAVTGGGSCPPPLFHLIGSQVGDRLAIMQGVAQGSRQSLGTLVCCLHKRERGGGVGGWAQRAFLTPGDGGLETRGYNVGEWDLGT